jgi:hypothetical protein
MPAVLALFVAGPALELPLLVLPLLMVPLGMRLVLLPAPPMPELVPDEPGLAVPTPLPVVPLDVDEVLEPVCARAEPAARANAKMEQVAMRPNMGNLLAA